MSTTPPTPPSGTSKVSTAFPASGPAPVFLFVKIPVSRRTVDPLHLREHELDQALRAAGVGTVVGWGDSLGAARSDGKRIAAFIRIDITAADLDAVRTALHTLLPALGSPANTQIHYSLGGRHCMDLATQTGWQLTLPPPAATAPEMR